MVYGGCLAEVCFKVPVDLHINTYIFAEGCEKVACSRGLVGQPFLAVAESNVKEEGIHFEWHPPMHAHATATQMESGPSGIEFTNPTVGQHQVSVTMSAEGGDKLTTAANFSVSPALTQMIGGKVGVTLSRTTLVPTRDQALWVAIRDRTRAISFGSYHSFINRVLCQARQRRYGDRSSSHAGTATTATGRTKRPCSWGGGLSGIENGDRSVPSNGMLRCRFRPSDFICSTRTRSRPA